MWAGFAWMPAGDRRGSGGLGLAAGSGWTVLAGCWSYDAAVMRFLFTFAGGGGHFDPLGPIARGAEDAGHVVAFGCQPGMTPVVEAAGFTAFDTGGDTLGGPQRRAAHATVGWWTATR